MSKDDLYMKRKDSYVLLISGKKVIKVNISLIRKIEEDIFSYLNVFFDKEGYICMLRNAREEKYKHQVSSFDDTTTLKSLFCIYKTQVLNRTVFTLCEGHLGYCFYMKRDLEEGGFSKIVYYKNTQLVKKRYVLCNETDEESYYSSYTDNVTRTTVNYKKDIKRKKDPEEKDDCNSEFQEISFDMMRELALFSYFSNSNVHNVEDAKYIRERISEMAYIDLECSSVYFPKYVELKYKHHRFAMKRHFYQLIYTMYLIYQQGIMHGDLKPYNIYLDKHSDRIKIGDWGLMQVDRTDDWSANKQGKIQTQSYRAPEVEILKEYTYKADIWTLGLMLLEASQRERLTKGLDTYDDVLRALGKILFCNIKEEIKNNQINKGAFLKFQKFFSSRDTNKELVKLVFKMMLPNPKLRIGYEDILSSPYFKEFKFTPKKREFYKTPFFRCDEKYISEIGGKRLNFNRYILTNSRCILGNFLNTRGSETRGSETKGSDTKENRKELELACLLISCKLFARRVRSIAELQSELLNEDSPHEDEILNIEQILKWEKEILKTLNYQVIYNFNFDYSKDTFE